MAEPRFDIIAPHSEKYKRHSEGSIIMLPDGQLLMGWTAFYGGFHDASPAHILAMRSDDGGETWSEPVLMLENDGKCNVMNVCFAQPGDGSIVMSPRAHGRRDVLLLVAVLAQIDRRRPHMDGTQAHGGHGDVARLPGQRPDDRPLQRAAHRAVRAKHDTARPGRRPGCCCSRRARTTWARRGSSAPTCRRSSTPTTRARASPWSSRGRTARCSSSIGRGPAPSGRRSRVTGAETVSEPWDTGVQCPAAPCIVKRIPSTGDLLLIWNNAKPDRPGSGGPRMPLTTAISRDDGEDLDQRQGPGAGPQPQLHVPVADVRRRHRAHTVLAGGVRLGGEVVHQLA